MMSDWANWIWTHRGPAWSSVSGSLPTARPSLSPAPAHASARSKVHWSVLGTELTHPTPPSLPAGGGISISDVMIKAN